MNDDQIRDALAGVLAEMLGKDDCTKYYDVPGSAPGGRYADALMPTVRRLIADELRAAAEQFQAAADVRTDATVAGRVDEHRRGVGDGLEWAADDLRDRASRLNASADTIHPA